MTLRQQQRNCSPPNYAGGSGHKETHRIFHSLRGKLCIGIHRDVEVSDATGEDFGHWSRHPRNLGYTSTELPTERWRRWASQRASSSLPTERARPAIRPTVELRSVRPYGRLAGRRLSRNDLATAAAELLAAQLRRWLQSQRDASNFSLSRQTVHRNTS